MGPLTYARFCVRGWYLKLFFVYFVEIGGNPSLYAVDVREKFKNYFVSETGSLPWQVEMVRRGRKN